MPGLAPTAVVILSVKSSGSSALQRALAAHLGGTTVDKTPHAEKETLFWTKAASVLGMAQVKLPNSEVPISKSRAKRMLLSLLRDNLGAWDRPLETKEDLFAAWTALVRNSGTIFIEKSPHHLYQRAAMDLMRDYVQSPDGVNVHFIGLIRNPLGTLYSSWRRFGIPPEVEERHWIRAYADLRELQAEWPGRLSIVRYEDVTTNQVDLAAAAGLTGFGAFDYGFHRRSLRKWKQDRGFGYQPSPEADALARSYGYGDEHLVNPHAHHWRLRAAPRAAAWRLFSLLPRNSQDRLKAVVKPFVRRG